MDRQGLIIVRAAYREVSEFKNGVARVKSSDVWRYIDLQCIFIKKPKQ
ncbi:MAG: WG repeat-containing protein [Bacteroides sp.]|nr:WG repeat-containing protein [Bacteroides sp.]